MPSWGPGHGLWVEAVRAADGLSGQRDSSCGRSGQVTAAPLPCVPISSDGQGAAEVTALGGGLRDVRKVLRQ